MACLGDNVVSQGLIGVTGRHACSASQKPKEMLHGAGDLWPSRNSTPFLVNGLKGRDFKDIV